MSLTGRPAPQIRRRNPSPPQTWLDTIMTHMANIGMTLFGSLTVITLAGWLLYNFLGVFQDVAQDSTIESTTRIRRRIKLAKTGTASPPAAMPEKSAAERQAAPSKHLHIISSQEKHGDREKAPAKHGRHESGVYERGRKNWNVATPKRDHGGNALVLPTQPVLRLADVGGKPESPHTIPFGGGCPYAEEILKKEQYTGVRRSG